MRRKFGNCWVEFRGPIDLMCHPPNMEIDLCWYVKGTNNKWSHNLTDQLVVNLKTMIVIPFMTYIVDLNAFELHPEDEKVFINLINRC